MVFYTIKGKKDGFGSQYLAIMSGIAICAYKKYNYVHTPFTKMQHNVNKDVLNKFIGIQTQEIPETELECILSEVQSCEVLTSKTPSNYFTEPVLTILRNYYYSSEKPIIPDISIAIHVRRGDITPKIVNRYTDNAYYIKIIQALKHMYPTYKITVFSEGNLEDFKDFGLEDSQFRLNEDIQTTFHSLVTAKILVIAKSAFSYSAAILNQNTVYYEYFFHGPLSHWLITKSLLNYYKTISTS
jgi:hypothetical protein